MEKDPALSALSFSVLCFWYQLRALSQNLINTKASIQNQKEYICTWKRRGMYLIPYPANVENMVSS